MVGTAVEAAARESVQDEEGLAARLLQALAAGAAAVREEIQEEGEVCFGAATLQQDYQDGPIA